MHYRKLGKTNLNVSLLGFGCMRLPFINGDGANGVDIPAALELIRYAAENGINYFDTAMTYHGGESETYLGEALEDIRRDVVYVTKQPLWEMPDKPTIRRNLENTLKKLRTDYIDVYLLHRIMPASWGEIKRQEIYAELDKFKQEGLIRHIGFSYHGDYETFKDVAAKYPWEMAKVQHNMLDMNREVTPAGIKFAGELNLGVAIMEPLRGGGLAHAPSGVKAVYTKAEWQRSPAEWAFRYLINIPQISVITSGMSNLQQLKDNIALFSQPDMLANALTPAEEEVIANARKQYEAIVTIPCTQCNYCIPCPAGVQIPHVFGLYNDAHRFEHFDQPRRAYMFAKNAKGDARGCTECGICLEKCPQEIDIIKDLKTAHAALDGWKE